ncbi:MAG: inositol monophosphatase [Thermoplasmata archaeon]|nr:inositol monophosphatase [Thermoplasmata archaeon]
MTGDAGADLEVLVRIAYAVHGVVRQARRSPHRADIVGMGAYGVPTEHIDRVAEAQVLSALEAEEVDWNLLSEEVGLVDRGGKRTLVLDPVDGSSNALRDIPFSSVSLALGRSKLGDIEAGVVHDLFRGTTYWASKGGGAFLDGQPIHTRAWDAKNELFFANLGRHSTPRSVALAGKVRRIRSLGCASLEMAMVAQGAADGYLFENDTANRNLRVTDIAAGYRILLEAGGGATDPDGAPLEKLPLDIHARTNIFAWGDPAFAKVAKAEGYR